MYDCRLLLLVLMAVLGCFRAPLALAGTSIGPPKHAGTADRESRGDPAAVEALARMFAEVVSDAIPRNYAKEKDWGRTKSITTGLRVDNRGLRLDIKRRKKSVEHGVWKRYRVSLVNPEQTLNVRVVQLRNIAAGRVALTLLLSAKLDGWAQAKVYNRGVHIIAVTASGETRLDLLLDCEIAARIETDRTLPVVVIDPIVKQAQLKLSDFHLERLGELRGGLAEELSGGLRRLVEESLAAPKLTRKLNRAIDKKRDRLRIGPEDFLASPWTTVVDPQMLAALRGGRQLAPRPVGFRSVERSLPASRPRPSGGMGVKLVGSPSKDDPAHKHAAQASE